MLATSGSTSERRLVAGALLVFALIVVVAVLDLATDVGGGLTIEHIAVEGTVIGAGLVGVALMAHGLWLGRQRMREALARTSEQLEAARREASRYRDEAHTLLQGLGEVIDRELDRWQLTGAEKEVALLLLKGLSHKEIAAVRGVSEATARQQGGAVYRKAGVAGRNELAAYFLEDLMLPVSHGGAAETA